MQLLLCLLLLVAFASAEFDTGFARSLTGFAFLGKFCFGTTPAASKDPAGSITVRIAIDTHIAATPKDMHFLVYDDEPESWPAIYNHPTMSCQEKMSKALLNVPVTFSGDTWIWEHQGLVFEHTRPRFWYAVLANCRQIDFLVYNLVWVNSAASPWQREFGVNEQGLNTIYTCFFAAFACIACVHALGLRQYWENSADGFIGEVTSGFASVPALHRTFSAGLLIITLSLFFEMVHLFAFMSNGFGSPILHLMAYCMRLGAQLLLLFLLLLVASGWAVSTESVPNRALIGVVFSALGFLYFLLFFWAAARDRASTLYLYDSFPGYAIALCNMACGGLFLHWLRDSHASEQNEAKKHFYYRLGLGYAWWFFSLFVVILISSRLNSWQRECAVTGMQLGVDLAAFAAMVFLLWPSRAAEYFSVAATPNVGDEYDNLINENI